MKIAATVSGYQQVSQTEWRDWGKTKVFDEHHTIKNIMDWAKTVDPEILFCGIKLSEVDD